MGFFYSLVPHTFCILFIVFSVVGVTSTTLVFKNLLLNRNFFYYLIILSFVFATLSAFFFLVRNKKLSFTGLKRSWQYLTILYGTTIVVNTLLFLVIFPVAANFSLQGNSIKGLTIKQSVITLRVDIPCSGHAPLITGEIKKLNGVTEIKFRFPNIFDIYYDANKLGRDVIFGLEIFKTYKAEVIK